MGTTVQGGTHSQPSRRRLTMGEIVRRAGVTPATVHHYVSLGLLPAPERPHRRMAYYDPACIERIAQIKSLQTRRFLPLGVIKQLIDSGGENALREADAKLVSGMDVADVKRPRANVIRRHPIGDAALKGLIEQRLISAGKEPFSADETAIIAAVHAMRQAGPDERLGFSTEQLGVYRQMVDRLIDSEFAGFNERVLGRVSPDEEVRLASAAIEASSKLLTALHRRMVRARLDGLSRGNAAIESSGKPLPENGRARHKRELRPRSRRRGH